jgi:hypothetical protein
MGRQGESTGWIRPTSFAEQMLERAGAFSRVASGTIDAVIVLVVAGALEAIPKPFPGWRV